VVTITQGATVAANSDEIVIPHPAGLVGGEVLLAVLINQNTGLTADAVATGWERVGPAFVPSDVGVRLCGLYRRVYVPGDPAPLFDMIGGGRLVGHMIAVTGIEPDPISNTGYTDRETSGNTLAMAENPATGWMIELWGANFSAGQSAAFTAESPLPPIMVGRCAGSALDPDPEDTSQSRTVIAAWAGDGPAAAHSITTTGNSSHAVGFQVVFPITVEPSTEHSVFADTTPAAQTVFDDGDPTIMVGSNFYTTSHAESWWCTGGRILLPNDSRVLGQPITLNAWTTTVAGDPVELGDTPLRTITVQTPPTAGWFDIEWEPFEVIASETVIMIGYEFPFAQDLYIHATPASAEVIQATDGSTVWFAETGVPRSRYKIGAAASQNSAAWYGTDVMISETEPEQPGIPILWSLGGGLTTPARLAISDGLTARTPSRLRPFGVGYPSVDAMLAEPGFTIAHRGGSRAWPEMSIYAYCQSQLAGYKAVEVSLARTADGVWFGHHDQTLLRTSGVDIDPATLDWADVQALMIDGSLCEDNPATADRPYARLEELLPILSRTVVFVDPKYAMSHVAELFDVLDTQPNSPQDRFVAKFFGQQGGMPEDATSLALIAANRGYQSWGYFYEGGDFTYAPRWSILGMDLGASQTAWDDLAAAGPGKPIIGHIAVNQTQYATAISKGAAGVVVSGVTNTQPV
jgi:hypothetical protein